MPRGGSTPSVEVRILARVIPPDKDILAAFPEAPGSLHLKDLLRALDLPPEDRIDLRERVRHLAAEGRLERLRGRHYGRPMQAATAVGTLTVNPRGFAFLAQEGDGEDLYVQRSNMGDALHRDRVRAIVQRGTKGRHEAVVTEVLERGTHTFVATYRTTPRARILHPQDDRLPEHVQLEGKVTASDGDLVAARFTRFPQGRIPGAAEVIKVFGADGEAAKETDLIVYDLGLPIGFDSGAEREAEAFPAELPAGEVARRVDLRERPLVTIDPESARDFDDAVHAEPRDAGGWILTVAVADVSHYVRPGTVLDREANARGTSVYLPDRVLPMLPHRLSSDLCSLRPNVDRFAMAVEIEVEPNGDLGAVKACEAVIRSHARFTYDRAGDMLGLRGADPAPDSDSEIEALRPHLEAALHATRALRARRRRRGYLDLAVPEPKVVLGSDGEIETMRPAPRHEAHKLVEEAMLAANEGVARSFVDREEPALFRTHDRPSPEKLARFRNQANALGAHADKNKVRPHAGRLTKWLRKLGDHPQQALLNTLLLRSMARAVYEEEPAPHFGLGSSEYLHFTSPIRRYPDLVVHRLVKQQLAGEPRPDAEALAAIAAHAGRRERLALDAERTVMDLYKALLLQKHEGEEFDGLVVSVTSIGLFVQLDEHLAEGLLSMDALTDDYYEHNYETDTLVGRRTNNVWALGDRVRVGIEHVEVRRRRVHFALVGRLARD